MTSIRTDEWMAELARLEAQVSEGPPGFTSLEVQRALGVSERAVGVRMREWFRAGRIELAGYREQRNMAGRRCRTPVYRLRRKT